MSLDSKLLTCDSISGQAIAPRSSQFLPYNLKNGMLKLVLAMIIIIIFLAIKLCIL